MPKRGSRSKSPAPKRAASRGRSTGRSSSPGAKSGASSTRRGRGASRRAMPSPSVGPVTSTTKRAHVALTCLRCNVLILPTGPERHWAADSSPESEHHTASRCLRRGLTRRARSLSAATPRSVSVSPRPAPSRKSCAGRSRRSSVAAYLGVRTRVLRTGSPSAKARDRNASLLIDP
jgi:hypothetical protein